MPRPRNPETTKSILDASRSLFASKGYQNTSYTDIAEASGVNRATVQKYYPKKEQMAALALERLRDCAKQVADEAFPEVEDAAVEQYLLGQVYIASLLGSEGARNFLCDTLADRSLANEAIVVNFEWSAQLVRGDAGGEDAADEALRQDTVVAMGGLFELMYYSVTTGQPFDIAKRLMDVLKVGVAPLRGMTAEQANDLLAPYAQPCDALTVLGTRAFSLAFGRQAR